MTKVTKPERNPLDDIAAELAIANAHFQEHNALLAEQTSLIKSNDWKLWIISNAIIDGLLKAKLIDIDPRLPVEAVAEPEED
jgi:hypothetical protein